jgi:histidyl-tRNA synthetase
MKTLISYEFGEVDCGSSILIKDNEGVEIQQKEKVMRELDKLNKIGEDNVKANLKKYADANQIITLFKLLQKPLDFFIENAFDGAKELDVLIEKGSKNDVKIVFSPFMIRGLGYYTGNIFEVRVGENGASIAAGGRYDKVVGKYLYT